MLRKIHVHTGLEPVAARLRIHIPRLFIDIKQFYVKIWSVFLQPSLQLEKTFVHHHHHHAKCVVVVVDDAPSMALVLRLRVAPPHLLRLSTFRYVTSQKRLRSTATGYTSATSKHFHADRYEQYSQQNYFVPKTEQNVTATEGCLEV